LTAESSILTEKAPRSFIPKQLQPEASVPAPLTSKDRVTLIHKGNEIFNQGKVSLAEKVFRTARYQDGLVRVAQHYYDKKEYLRAADIYRAGNYLKGEYLCYFKLGLVGEVRDIGNAEDRKKMDEQINKKLAAVVSRMMQSDSKN